MAAPLKISGFCCRNEKPLANFIYRFLSTNSATKNETRPKKESRETHFGFETVAEDEKEERGYYYYSSVHCNDADSVYFIRQSLRNVSLKCKQCDRWTERRILWFDTNSSIRLPTQI